MQEKLSRFVILSVVVAAIAMCAHKARAQTYYPHSNDTFYYDASGNLVGERMRFCNNSIDQWGQVTQNRIVIPQECSVIYQTTTSNKNLGLKCTTYWYKTTWEDQTITYEYAYTLCN